MTFQPSERPVVTVTRLLSPQFWHGSWDASVVFPILFVTSHPSSHPCVSRSTRLFTLQDQTHDDFFSFYHQPLPMGECCIRLQKWSSLEVCPSLTWVCTLHGGPCGSPTHFCWVFPVLAWDLCGSQSSIPSVTSSTMEPSLRFQRLTSPSRVCCLQHSAPDERTLISEAQLDPSVCLSVSGLCWIPPPSFQTTLLSHHPAELPARSWSSLEFVLLPRDPSQAAFCFFCVLSQTAAAWPPW